MATYTPRRRRLPLNWASDPLNRVDKSAITPAANTAGLDYNRRLYSPGSAEMRAVLGVVPAAPRAVGWTPQPLRAGMYSTPYGRISQTTAPRAIAITPPPTIATPPPLPPALEADDSGAGDMKRLEQFLPGQSGALAAGLPAASGAAGPTGPDNPMLNEPGAPVTPPLLSDASTAGAAAGGALIGAGASPGVQFDSQNPVTAQPVVDPMNPNAGTSTQGGLAPGNQRRYRDTTGRIDARATVSPQDSTPAPVQFRNEVPGHSDWQPY